MKNLSSIEVMRGLVLVAAVLLWLNVYGFQNRQMVVTAPVKIVGLMSEMAVVEPVTGIEVTLSGSSRALAQVNQQTLGFVMNLTGISSVGEYEADVELDRSPKGVNVITFSPVHWQLTLDYRTTKEVPVSVALTGSVANGYHVTRTSPAVASVTLSGAADLLGSISEAVVPIQLGGQSKSFSTVADITAVDSQNRPLYNVNVAPTNMAVQIDIARGVATRTLGLSPIFAGELPGGYWIREVVFEPSVLTVQGDDAALKELEFLSTTPIQLSGRRDSFYEQVGVELPLTINVVGGNVVSAHVIVERAGSTNQINVVPQFANVGENFSLTSVEPASIRVVLSGEAEALANLSRSDVALTIDLAGALTGQNVIELTGDMFTTNPNLSVISFTPDRLEVILSRNE
ncbi:MAG: CdaR family protein [Patescibacteria group bacterium]|nr:CdaR family protein [Patescibacteria group bacterium]